MIVYPLNEIIDVAGEWWPSDRPEFPVAGQLHFNSGGIELELNQAFDPPKGEIRVGDPIPQYPAIYGTTVKGEAVTLLDAQQLGVSMNYGSGGFRNSAKIYAQVLLFGAHMPVEDCFLKVGFRVPGLQVWLGRQVIDEKNEAIEDAKPRTQSFELKLVPEESFFIPSIEAVASCSYSLNSNSDRFSSIVVEVSSWFSFEPEEPRTIDWFLQQQERFLTIVSFLSGRPMAADAIQAKFDDSVDRVNVLVAMQGQADYEGKTPHDFFLSRPFISEPFEKICNKWFELAPQVSKPAALARSIMASEKLWLHMEFLSLMQALEGLHRALYDGEYMEDGEYELVKKS